MDGGRFDRMARLLAERKSRRGALALAGITAAALTPAVAAQDTEDARYVTCGWRVEAELATGVDAGRVVTGLMLVTIDREGWIDEATFAIDAPEGTPPRLLQGVGMANGRSIDLRFEDEDGCGVLALTGVGDGDLRACEAFVDGWVRGRRLADLGGWRAAPDHVCPEGEAWDGQSCGCVAPCAERECAEGEVWRANACTCSCAPEACDEDHGWSWSTCACVPKGDVDEPDQPEATATPPEITLPPDTGNQCPTNLHCPAPKELDPADCRCVCPTVQCAIGFRVDPDTCECELPVICLPQPCNPDYYWDQAVCGCRTQKCVAGQIKCGGKCYDAKTTATHCGTCGNVCANTCVEGVCT